MRRIAVVLGLSLAACGLGVSGQLDVGSPSDRGDGGGDDASAPEAAADAAPEAETSVDAGPYATRVKTGLLAFYDFEEGTGDVVKDAIPPAADLATGSHTDYDWVPHGILLKDDTLLVSASNVDKIATSYASKKELSVEAWVVPAKKSAEDYGRLVTLAGSPTDRAFALGTFQSDVWWASMYDAEDLQPDVAANKVEKKLTHLAMTHAADGTLALWVDGVQVGTRAGTGNPADFKSHKLGIGNVPSGEDRSWLGEIRLVALYDHALSAAEVAQNMAAGPDP